jgi:hypothetical protein
MLWSVNHDSGRIVSLANLLLPLWGISRRPLGPPRPSGALGACWAGCAHRTLLGLADRRRRDRLYRPLPPPDLEAREALQAPETNRSRPS